MARKEEEIIEEQRIMEERNEKSQIFNIVVFL
jgi:hypothetical protein